MSRLYRFPFEWKIITMEVTEDWNLAWIERYLYNYFDLHEIYFTWVSGEIWVSKIKNKQALAFLKNFRCLSLLNFIGCFRRWSLICFGVNSRLDTDMIIILVRNQLAIEKKLITKSWLLRHEPVHPVISKIAPKLYVKKINNYCTGGARSVRLTRFMPYWFID